MKYSQRVQRDDERPAVPTYCGNKGCGSIWHPPKDGHEGFYSRGFADIAVHLPDRTIYRCQKCYYDTLDGHGKTQHQVASAEYGKRHGDKEADHRGYDHH